MKKNWNNNISRRSFLKGTAAGAVGLAAASLAAPVMAEEEATAEELEIPPIISKADFEESEAEFVVITPDEEVDYDIVVVGAGTAGVPAALSAFEAGCKVACLQKQAFAVAQGGNASGFYLEESDPGAIPRFLQAFNMDCNGRAGLDLVKMYIETSGETLDWIIDRVGKGGMEPASSHPQNFVYEDGKYTLYNTEINYGPKPLDVGDAMRALAGYAEEQGVEFYYSCPGVQLVKEDGRVCAVIGHDLDSDKYIRFNAKKAVILATGDYQNNSFMVKRFCPDVKDFDKKQSQKTGDGHLMGMLMGAQVENVGHTHMMHDFDAGPMGSLPFLAVNDNGERFMNEETKHIWVNNILRYQPHPGYFTHVFDSNYETDYADMRPTAVEKLERYIPGFAEDTTGLRAELLDTHRADTLEELAEIIGLPVDTFLATVERYNELCEKGEDEDFGKMAKNMIPIKQPPFWGIHRHIRVSGIDSGLLINTRCQCKDADGEPIPGLYAAGNTSGQLCGSNDWSMYCSGMSVGWGFISGRRAGLCAAEEEV